MKKFILSLIASMAFIQSSYAAVSPLSQSLREYEAITLAIGIDPIFDIIPQNEFIVGINRITRPIDSLGKVRYQVLTRSLEDGRRRSTTEYIMTLIVTPNEAIGPNVITVTNFIKVVDD